MTSLLTQQQINEAKHLRTVKGYTWTRLAELFGCNSQTVKRAIDPVYAAKRREQVNANRDYTKAPMLRDRGPYGATKADVAARLAEIPPDTRSLTGRMFGDPIPNDPRRQRSA